jgi:cytochrome oxidase Cu insertion factor (SCO1/SenC/PrrC family)
MYEVVCKPHLSEDNSVKLFRTTLLLLVFVLITSACAPVETNVVNTIEPQATIAPTTAVTTPEWFDMELTDAQTGEIFTMNDYAGKVVLLETMAIWCPNCVVQANEVRNLHKLLGNSEDLISVSLDVDLNEDQVALKEYASGYGFEWHFAVAPLLVARALGNLYTAQYLNPPLSPMLIIDRDGNVHHLEYGLKEAETLQEIVEPYLAK